MKTLDRYLVREALALLLLGEAALLLLFLGAAVYEVLAPLVAKGAEAGTLLFYLAYRTPEALVRSLPVAYLFALLMLFSRLGEESELKALLALGVGAGRVLWPLLLLGLALGGVGLWLGNTWVPRALAQGQDLLRRAVLERPRGLLQPGASFKDQRGRTVYVGQVQGDRVGELRLLSADEVLLAEEGRFRAGVLEVGAGQRITYRPDGRPRTLARFQRGEVVLKDLTFDPWTNPANTLPLGALRAQVASLKAQGLRAGLEATTYYRRFAEPMAAPVFALFAPALGFFLLRASRGLGWVGVAVLTFFYYATWSVFRILGEQGALVPWLAAWGPNLLYGGLGLLLLGARR